MGAQGAVCEVGAAHHGKVSAPQKCPSRQFLDDCNLSRSVRNAFLLWSALPQGQIIPPVQRDADSQLSFISLRCRFPDPGTPPC